MSKLLTLAICAAAITGVAHADSHRDHDDYARPAQRASHWGADSQRPSATASVSAPEIDPASAMAGLTLLLGGLAVVRGRRK